MTFTSDTKIYDLNDCELSDRNGMYGGMAGSKEGIIFNNEYWMVKYPKSTKLMNVDGMSYTTSPLSEYIGSQIYKILGYDVHETILGERNNKIVVACKDFCKSAGDLREIRTLKNIYNEQLERLLEIELEETGSSHVVDLKELLIHLDNNPVLSTIPDMKTRFWDCVVIDGLIRNNDRNNGNWGLLYENGSYKIAPIFDNGACLSPKLTESKIERILSDENMLLNSSLNVLTAYGFNGHHLNLKRMIDMNIPDLNDAILRITPKIAKNLDAIKQMINDIPKEYKGIVVCSDIRKELYVKGIEIRYKNLIEPAHERLVNSKIKEQKGLAGAKDKALSKVKKRN